MIATPTAMSKANVDTSQVPYEALESIRHRLNQVYVSLRKLADQIRYSPTGKIRLPNYAHFVNQFQVLITQLNLITITLNQNIEVLTHTNVYPLPAFPTSQQEGLLTTLLRKKVLPEVDEWIDTALKCVDGVDDDYARWCSAKVLELREDALFFGFHTQQEVDAMNTDEGQRANKIKQENEKQVEQEQAAITRGKAPIDSNDLLKFMCTGNIELQ